MTGDTFNRITSGDIFLAYVNDNGNDVICRTNEPSGISRLINNEGARVIPFSTLLICYEVYIEDKSINRSKVSFSDWVIGEDIR